MSILQRLASSAKALWLLLPALWGAGGQAGAQCPIPDQLDGGPCCAQAAEVVPWFPQVSQPSLDICWRDCGVASVLPCRAVWTPIKILPPTGADCSYHTARLDIYDAVGTLQWTGTMRLLYSRTWMETKPPGTPIQVWRYLVNGYLRPTTGVLTVPCPMPPCTPAFGNVRFTGYIDYARDCTAAAGLEIAWSLTHACDVVDHAPGFPRAGVFHPGLSYTFVGPSAGFVPAPVVAAEGTPGSPFEAVRRLRHPPLGTTGPILCEFEERFGHSLTTTPLCLCSGGPPLSAQWVLGVLTGGGSCGTAIATPASTPFLPGYLSMGVGTWTLPGTYPGPEALRWNAGSYDYTDPCTGAVRPEVFYGVTTLGGYPATQVLTGVPGLPLPLTFIDQANSIRPGGAPLMNVVFRSDHILNLNE